MKKTLKLAICLLLACGIASCQGAVAQPTATLAPSATDTQAPTLTKTPIPTSTESPKPSTTPTLESNCDPNQVIENLNPTVDYDIFRLSYQIYDGVRYINFWIVDPALNVTSTQDQLSANVDIAMSDAIDLANQLNQADACLSEVFAAFNPVVVDQNFNGWFSGVIPIESLPASGVIDDANREAIRATIREIGAWERYEVTEIQTIPANSCSWDEMLENVSRHFYTAPLNNYILVADNNGITFTVQYATITPEDIQGDTVVTFLNTGREVGCFLPPIDYIAVIIVDENGEVLSVDRIPLQ